MVRETLIIRTDNGLGDSNPTFKGIELTEYSAKFSRMGMPELTATLKWPTVLDDEWTGKEYVTLRDERFYIRHTPSGKKDNQDARYSHEITFTSEVAEILGNTYFIDAVPDSKFGINTITANKPCTNSTKFSFYGTIREFVDRLNCAFLARGIGDSILNGKTTLTTNDAPAGDGYCAMLDPYGDYDKEAVYNFEWEDKSLWDAITEGYNITEIPFERRGKKIIYGAIPNVVAHKFEYGHDNELLSVHHKNANAKVINRITMLGSSENIPHYYPNETEYGHISIKAKAGNKALTAEMVGIENMTQLLSRINAGQHAVLGKYGSDSEGNPVPPATANGYKVGFDSYDDLEDYAPNTFVEYTASTLETEHAEWYVKVGFDVTEEGEIECRDILADAWFANGAPPSDAPKYATAQPWKLEKSDGSDISQQMFAQNQPLGNSIKMGRLGVGSYVLTFSIEVLNYIGDKEPLNVVMCRLAPVTFAFVEEEEESHKTGYYWDVNGKKYDGVGALGVKIENVTDAMIGDGFGWQASGRMPFQTSLVPPKYRNTLGAERFYSALNAPYSEEYASAHPEAYIDPDTGNPYVFPNPFVEGAPSEHIHRDESVKPTIEGVANDVVKGYDEDGNPIYELFGEIAAVAYDEDDSDALKSDATEENDKNDALKYEHSFFYIKLNKFSGDYGFDLFKAAAQTGAMTIQMRSGSCNGCKFKVQAAKFTDETGLESYKNPVVVRDGAAVGVVSEDGIKESDLDPTQQNTQTHSIWICVQKDASTFGVILPNQSSNFKPKAGDKFNIADIALPQAYIDAAEKLLEQRGMRYMADNNEEKFTFDISASRIFFAENSDVLAELDEYSKIKVKYNGKEYEQYVSQLSIDCKDSEALPNIGIGLADTLAVGQSFQDQVAERAASLIANPYVLGGNAGTSGGGSGLSASLADKRYLNKQKSDRTPHKLASDVGFEVGEFVSGGSGGIFYQDPKTGQTYLEVDKIKARMKAIFAELEIAKEKSIGGKFDITPGGGIDISFVEETPTAYRCYFKAKEEDKGADCRFVVGDQARCQESNISAGTTQNASNRYYWRLVTAVNNAESYIELSKSDCDTGSDAPMAGDTIVQLGNRNVAERQSAIVLSTVDAFAPCVTLYNGIGEGTKKSEWYSLVGKSVVEYGVDKTKTPPEPFFNCYGRFFFGPRSRSSFLEFNPTTMTLEYKGILHVDSKIGDKTIENYVKGIIPLDDYNYLKQALGQDTDIAGGLILTSAISLGYKDADGVRHTTTGMNGMGLQPKAIASWWGGDMVDRYYDGDGGLRGAPLDGGYAQSLVRMDGSGYFSGGQIRWTESGQMVFGSGIKLGGGDTTIGAVESIVQLFNTLASYLVPMKKVGDAESETSWEEVTSGAAELYAIKSVKGFYSEEFISAKGINASGSGAGGSGFGLLRAWTDPTSHPDDAFSAQVVWNKINSLPTTSVNPYALTIQKNGTTVKTYDGSQAVTANITIGWSDTASGRPAWIGSTKPSYNFSEIGSKPTTLAGYGITDAKIDGGAITLGTDTITPLVSADMKTLTFQSGTFSAKTYTPTSAQTVNIPTKTSHLTNDSDFTTNALLTSGLATKLPTATFDSFKSGYDTWKATVDAFVTKLNSMFELETDADSPDGKRIKAKFGLYSPYYLSARGANANGTGGSTSFGRLDDWSYYNANGTDALSATLGFGLKSRIETLEGKNYLNDLLVATSGSGNAVTSITQSADKKTITVTKGSTFLTSHQPIRTLTIQKNGTTVDTFNPTATTNKTINITDVASAATLSSHTGNTTVHITAAERTKWNTAATNLSDILGSDANGVIDKWDEIVAFLDTYDGANNLATLLSNKADKATQIIAGAGLSGGGTLASDRTLSLATSGVTAGTYTKLTVDAYGRVTAGSNPTTLTGYGITDAYTKTEADGRYVNVSGDTMTGLLTLNAGAKVAGGQKLTIGDCEITWDATSGGLKFSKGIYSEGFVSARGVNSSGSGSAGGGLIQSVYGWSDLGGSFSDTLTDTFNAYTINKIYAEKLNATKAAIESLLTGNITTHSHPQYLTSHQSLADYAKKSEVNSALSAYLPLTGGTLTAPLTIQCGHDKKLILNNTDGEKYSEISFQENGVEYASMIVSDTATMFAGKPLKASRFIAESTALCTNLNADLLDGYHAGYENGRAAVYCSFPTYASLVAGGYMDEDPTRNTYLYLKGLLRWAAANHLGHTLIGAATPNSTGFLHLHVYSSGLGSGSDQNSAAADARMPRYCSGVYFALAGAHVTFGTNDGVWYQTGAFAGNASSATKLYDNTSYKAWGHEFFVNGTPKAVSGNMTDVANIEASGNVLTHAGSAFGLSASDPNFASKGQAYYQPMHASGFSRIRMPYGGLRFLSAGDSPADVMVLDNEGTLSVRKLVVGSGANSVTVSFDTANGALKVDKGLYSTSFVSARGLNPSGAGGGAGYNRLDAWADYGSDKAGWVLSAALGADLDARLRNVYGKATIDQMLAGKAPVASLGAKLDKYGTDGVLEIARYLDFHTISGGIVGTEDHTVRLDAGAASASRTFTFPTSGGTLATETFVTGKGYALASALGDYLPLAGGTLSGTKDVLLAIDSSNSLQNIVVFRQSGVSKTQVGYNVNMGSVMYNYASQKYLGIKDDGTPHFQGNTIWHQGNDGSGSGLDADMIDGVHLTSLFRGSLLGTQNLDANNLTTPWVCYTSNSDMNGWGNATFTNFPTERPAGGFCLLHLKEGNYAKQLYTVYNDNHLYIRNTHYSGGVVWSGWSTLALISDNVASATQLQTAHTLWGRPFNGTADVTGLLSDVDGIVFSQGKDCSIIGYNNHEIFRDHNNGMVTVNATGGDLYFGRYNTGIVVFFSGGAGAENGLGTERMRITPEGNVGIGKASPQRKLHVNGDQQLDGTLWARSIELTGMATPYIDFHYGSDAKDYTSRIIAEADGQLAILGTLRVSVGMYSNGYVSARGQNTSSDSRLKVGIEPFSLPLRSIADAPSVSFGWADGGGRDLGSIAQYWRDVHPLLAPTGPDGYLTLQYGKAALLSAITLAQEHLSLEQEVKALRRKCEALEKELETLKEKE